LLNTQAKEERVKLDGVEKEIAEEMASIQVICGCGGVKNAGDDGYKVFDVTYVVLE
jgi:hypothetical protein